MQVCCNSVQRGVSLSGVYLGINVTNENRPIRLGAVHALLNSIQPTQTAFEKHWASADVAHLLDGSLYLDRSRGTATEAELSARIGRLIRYSASTGIDGILFTGSFFGEAVRQARKEIDIPVLASFDGLIARACTLDAPLEVIATAPESVRLLVTELEAEAVRLKKRLQVSGCAVSNAMDALIAGDATRHDQLVLEQVEKTAPDAIILFAQFSMERVLAQSNVRRRVPVIGPAGEGVRRLLDLVG